MHSTLLSLLLLLSASVGAVALVRRLRLPSVLAYLALGVALGPHGAALITSGEGMSSIAEFGVVFLMFSIGLEFSLTRLKAMRAMVFGLGPLQMILTAAGTGLITYFYYGQGWRTGMAIGLAVAMSSTAIVAKMLSERFELHSRSGRQTMGVLLFQDLAVVPCLILFPALAGPGGDLPRALAVGLLQALVVLAALIWLGQKLMRRLFDAVARVRSDELFVLTALWVVVGLSWLTGQAGLSLALGAFVAGMLLSETAYRNQVEADVRPFRDMLLGLFFITIGMMLDLRFVLAHFDRLLLAVALLLAGKAIVVLLATLGTKSPLDVALRTTAQLAQAGEFGLVLMEFARELGLVGHEVFQVTLSAMLVSMFLAPSLIGQAARLGDRMLRGDWAHRAKAIHDVAVSSLDFDRHVILCGYGRTGQRIGEFLAAEAIPFLALDLDPQVVQQSAAQGGNVAFGNADRAEVLQAAGLARARALVITYPDTASALRVLGRVRKYRPDLPVIVRAPDDRDRERLKLAGATEVIPDVLEGSLMIAAETLAQLGVPMERAVGLVRSVRAERYPSLRSFYGDSR